jgi:hypothetical protein
VPGIFSARWAYILSIPSLVNTWLDRKLHPIHFLSSSTASLFSFYSPFFEKILIELDVPSTTGWLKRKLSITTPGAHTKPYIKSLTINNKNIKKPIIKHAQLIGWESDLPKIAVMHQEKGNFLFPTFSPISTFSPFYSKCNRK